MRMPLSNDAGTPAPLAAAGPRERIGGEILANSSTDALIVGGSGDDTLTGTPGDDTLNGGPGADTMTGGNGNDKYIVDHPGDLAIEGPGGGNDSVSTVADYQLTPGSHIERLNSISWALTTPLKLTGNEFANLIEGNAGNNILDGRGGADRLVGFGGDDKYVVDNAGDVVVELAGGGNDSISTLIDYTLAPGSSVEWLNSISWLLATPLKLTGNELANLIEGNNGHNTLDGRGGADTLKGFFGDDKYIVDNAGDLVIEAADAGYDTVSTLVDYTLMEGSRVERLTSISWALTTPLQLTGNGLVNLIQGNAGNNYLDGKLGNDTLVGFGGADSFAFTTAPGAGNLDFFADFVSGTDKILLDHTIFTGLPLGALSPDVFSSSGGNDGNDRIIFNPGLGFLSFDADGGGPGSDVYFALLQPGGVVTASDFTVI